MDIKHQVAHILERPSERVAAYNLCDTFDGCPSDPDSNISLECAKCIGDIKIETLNKFNPEWKDNLLITIQKLHLLGEV